MLLLYQKIFQSQDRLRVENKK